MEYQTENQKCMAMELRTKLNSLWDRLRIDVTYREHFVSSKKGFGKTVINEVCILFQILKCMIFNLINCKKKFLA